MKIVNFGAGNIGKGLIGYLLSKEGHSVTFLDTNQEVVNDICSNNSYIVEVVSDVRTLETVKNVSAINLLKNYDDAKDALLDADLITTSVGTDNLKKISKILCDSLLLRKIKGYEPVDIIPNENMVNAGDFLKSIIYGLVQEDEKIIIDEIAGFKNSAIDRQAIPIQYLGSTIPSVESYYEWVIEEAGSVNDNRVRLESAEYVSDLQYYIERKLYCVNAGHASAAYLGYVNNYSTVQEALADPNVLNIVKKTIIQNGESLVEKYGTNPEDISEIANSIVTRHGNLLFNDPVYRVGRNPMRKLGSKERLSSQVEKLYQSGKEIEALVTTIGAALNFYNSSDIESNEMREEISRVGITEAIINITGIQDKEVVSLISDSFTRFAEGEKLKND